MYKLYNSTRTEKKLMVITPNGKTIHFGSAPYQDYTLHHDDERKARYITRHQKREDWTKKGINTAGFWARWILWNQKTLKKSIHDTAAKFNISIEYDSHHK